MLVCCRPTGFRLLRGALMPTRRTTSDAGAAACAAGCVAVGCGAAGAVVAAGAAAAGDAAGFAAAGCVAAGAAAAGCVAAGGAAAGGAAAGAAGEHAARPHAITPAQMDRLIFDLVAVYLRTVCTPVGEWPRKRFSGIPKMTGDCVTFYCALLKPRWNHATDVLHQRASRLIRATLAYQSHIVGPQAPVPVVRTPEPRV